MKMVMMRTRKQNLGVVKMVHKFITSAYSSSSSGGGFRPPPVQPQRRVVVTVGGSIFGAVHFEVGNVRHEGSGGAGIVAGLGLVTPLGTGVQTSWDQLLAGKTGVRALTVQDLKLTDDKLLQMLPSQVAAPVLHGTSPGAFDDSQWQNLVAPYFITYALCAAEEALTDANWHPQEPSGLEHTGVAIGGGIGCISDMLEAAQLVREQRLRRLSPFFIPRILINMAAGHVSIRYGFKGPNHAAVTACASGAHSVGDAARMIRFGDADVMVAGGTEASIDTLSIAGFCRARALSTKFNNDPERSSRPFDKDRDGFVMGEGAGVIVLEEYEHAMERGAKIYAEVRGYGMSGDAYHITQPSSEGRGAILAMTRALQQAGLQPEEIDYINAHATSTPLGDVVEARAIQAVFKEHASCGSLAFSSTKGATGHLLGAAGAVEAIFAILALHHGIAPATLNVQQPDPIFHDRFSPLISPRPMPIRAVLTNSFGFGGTNASLVFSSPP